MKIRKSGSWVLWYECVGFGLLLVLAWLDELVDLPHLLLGGHPHVSDLRDSFVETVPIILIWGVVFILTRRLLAHLHYLEGFLRVCAWCRKVGYHGKWMRLEDYFAEGFRIETTHGMCPECLKKFEEDTKEFYRRHPPAQAGAGKTEGRQSAELSEPRSVETPERQRIAA